MTDLKTVLVDALNDAAFSVYNKAEITGSVIRIHTQPEYGLHHEVDFEADRLATAVRDHFLDREKVRAALTAALARDDDYWLDPNPDLILDRLIEGLGGEARA